MAENKTQPNDFANNYGSLGADEIISLTSVLVTGITETLAYQDYQRCKDRISGSELFYKLRRLRQAQAQTGRGFEEQRALSTMYTELFLNEDVNRFLQAEKHLLGLLQEVFDNLYRSLEIETFDVMD